MVFRNIIAYSHVFLHHRHHHPGQCSFIFQTGGVYYPGLGCLPTQTTHVQTEIGTVVSYFTIAFIIIVVVFVVVLILTIILNTIRGHPYIT